MRKLMSFLVSVAIAATGATPAFAANGFDISDLWWDPDEPGWGLQIVQQSQTAYATLYVYDASGKPHWYNALLTPSGSNALGGPIYSGALNESRGSYWAAAPYDADEFQQTTVGTFTFDSPSTISGVIRYSIDGVSITKNVERFSLTFENFNGNYTGAYIVNRAQCTNPFDNGTRTLLATLSIQQDRSAMTIVAAMRDGDVASSCTFNGTYVQSGSIGNFAGTYACSSGEAGTIGFAEMGAQRFAIYGRISDGNNSLGCKLSGQFSATAQ